MKEGERVRRQTAPPRPSVTPIQYTICFLFVNADSDAAPPPPFPTRDAAAAAPPLEGRSLAAGRRAEGRWRRRRRGGGVEPPPVGRAPEARQPDLHLSLFPSLSLSLSFSLSLPLSFSDSSALHSVCWLDSKCADGQSAFIVGLSIPLRWEFQEALNELFYS